MIRILLVGNPNVGKSALFSRLTGTHIIASNYPGTTVGFTKGYLKLGGKQAEVIDVPGTYSLEPGSRAEEVAVQMLKDGDLIINVVDATNLERNLNLTLQLLERQTPTIVALNLWDDTRHRGISIDASCPYIGHYRARDQGVSQAPSRGKGTQKRCYSCRQ